jgi:hypothetical protein
MKKIVLLFLTSIFTVVLFAQQYKEKDHISPQEKLNNEYCTGLFKTYDGIIIDLTGNNESAFSYLNILNWLDGRAAGLHICYSRDKTPVPFIRNARASIFIDEVQVEPAFLNDLSIADIALIKIIKEPFIGAIGNGGGGVIAIYTIKGDDEDDETGESK